MSSSHCYEGRLSPELKAKWVEALRSGKFEQGNGFLCCDGKYCCLGVLAEVSGIGPELLEGRGVLAAVSMDLAGMLDAPNGIRRVQTALENMNDGHNCKRCSFEEIAAYIEANL